MITGIIVAAVVVGCVGIILGFFLGIAGEKFKVETDPREDAILEVLPGNNCGGCVRELIDHIDVFETEGIGKNRTLPVCAQPYRC